MDVIEAIKTRRSVRAWTNEEVSEEHLNQILESGRWSPSPLNSQPWHFIVVKEKTAIEAMCKDAKEGAFLKNAPVFIVISVERKIINPTDPQNPERLKLIDWLGEHDQYIYSAVCALQNMWLTVWSLGLGACCVTVERSSTYELLQIPNDQEIIAGLALGHILGSPVLHKDTDRKPLSEMVFSEKYKVKEGNQT